ncbi:MAG TPA: SNF2 helicase associated domain-containing protein [Anaerovoracaceae bacterium]|nr:SNF2 helicase associated domain-containing protein [Anaerovoracaceae bacterium]
MELKTKLSLTEIRDVAGSRIIFDRGEDYYRRDRVTDVRLWKKEDEEQLTSCVKGSKRSPYTTSICIDNSSQVTEYDCTCPAYNSHYKACKHIVALLLYRYKNIESAAYTRMDGQGPFDENYAEDDFDDDSYEEEDVDKVIRKTETREVIGGIPDSMNKDAATNRNDVVNKLFENVYGHYGLRRTGKAAAAVFTDPRIKALINRYAMDDSARFAAGNDVKAVPKLELFDGAAYLSLTVGNSRQYIVKNIETFCNNIKAGTVVTYGKDLELIHHIDAFETESKPFVRFILKKQDEKDGYSALNGRYSEGYGSQHSGSGNEAYGPERDKRNLKLMPSGLDELFDLLARREVSIGVFGATASYGSYGAAGASGSAGKPSKLTDNTPEFYLEIKELPNKNGFSLSLPDCAYILGEKRIYLYFSEKSQFGKEHNLTNVLYRCSQDFSLGLKDLITARLGSRQPLLISNDDMTSFYGNVLSELEDIVEIKGDTAAMKQFAPDEMEAEFYLDSPISDAITAAVKYRYGSVEIDPHDDAILSPKGIARDEKRERRLDLVMNKYFKCYDPVKKFSFMQGDDDLIYHFVAEGMEELSRLGQIFVSDRLKNMNVKKPPQISVGVRLESDLLHIDLDTGGLPPDEAMEALNQYRQKRKYYRMKDGSFLRLDGSGFSELAEMVEGLGLTQKDLSKVQITVPRYRALYLDNLLRNSSNVTFQRNGHFKSLIRNMKAIDDSDFSVPESLDPIMRGYQKDGYRWLATMDDCGFGGILADDMGLGKTLQILSLLLSKKEEAQDCSALVVCPASLILNWQNEIQKFAPKLRVLIGIGSLAERKALLKRMDDCDVVITSYDLLKRDIERYREKEFRYHIIDEAQFIKNYGTQNAKAVKIIKSRQRFALTGTPVENRLSELWSIFDFLMPGYLYTYKKFKETYEIDIVKNENKEKAAILSRQIAPFMLRRLKRNVLKELPEKIESVVYSQMEGEQKRLYLANLARTKKEIRDKIKEGGFENNKIIILALLTRLRQICCHPSLCYDEYTDESAKLEVCVELLLEATSAGHKALLFSQFTSMLELIEKRLKKEGFSYCMLTGATAKEKRMEMVDRFNEDDTQVFLISLKAGGTGLNLTAADVVIHYDPWWNIAVQNQATDRTHRIGQKNSVQVYKLIEKGTLEEKILKLQENKKDLADAIIKDDMSGMGALTQEALLELLQP